MKVGLQVRQQASPLFAVVVANHCVLYFGHVASVVERSVLLAINGDESVES